MKLYCTCHVNLMYICVCEYDIKLLNGFWIINNFSETRNVAGSKNYNFFPLPRFEIGHFCWLNKLYTASTDWYQNYGRKNKICIQKKVFLYTQPYLIYANIEDDNEKDFVLQNDVFIYYWAHDIHRLFRERLLSSTHESIPSIAMCEFCRYGSCNLCIWINDLRSFLVPFFL